MDKWHLLFLTKGSSLALMACLCLVVEGVVDMHPSSALLLRGLLVLIGLGGGYIFFEHSVYLFSLSGILSLVTRLTVRDYWDSVKRTAVNALPFVAFLVSAGALRWLAQ